MKEIEQYAAQWLLVTLRKTKEYEPKTDTLTLPKYPQSGILQNRQVTWTEAVAYRLLYKFQMAMGKWTISSCDTAEVKPTATP